MPTQTGRDSRTECSPSAEELGPASSEHLGKCPPAFMHIGSIGAALDLEGQRGGLAQPRVVSASAPDKSPTTTERP